MHNQSACPLDETFRRRAHDERRHQVLEHRTRPRNQRGAVCDRCHGTTKTKPVLRGNVVFCDCQKACEPRLRREQIVAVGIKAALQTPDSRSKATCGPCRAGIQIPFRARWCGRDLRATEDDPYKSHPSLVKSRRMALDCRAHRLGPEHEILASVRIALDRKCPGHIGYRLGENCELCQPRRDVPVVLGRLPQLDGESSQSPDRADRRSPSAFGGRRQSDWPSHGRFQVHLRYRPNGVRCQADCEPIPRMRSQVQSDAPPDCRCRPSIRKADQARADPECHTSCKNVRETSKACSMVDSVDSSRSTASRVPIQPKSRALAADRR